MTTRKANAKTKTVETERNAPTWRANGYRTIFRNGCIVLVKADRGARLTGAEKLWVRGVQNGHWMSDVKLDGPMSLWTGGTVSQCDPISSGDDVSKVTVKLDDMARTVFHCYCDAGVNLCDFCGGLREAPALPAAGPVVEVKSKNPQVTAAMAAKGFPNAGSHLVLVDGVKVGLGTYRECKLLADELATKPEAAAQVRDDAKEVIS